MDEFKTFIALSYLLTGISDLNPTKSASPLIDRMARDYLHCLKEQFGADFIALLTLYDGKSASSDPLASLVNDPAFKDQIESMAKQVVHSWLLSQIRIETFDASNKKGDSAPAVDVGFFEKGYIWPAIKAHPIGFSHQSHGYWAHKP